MTFEEEKEKRLNMKILDLLNYMKIDKMKMYELQIDSLDYEEEINFPNVRFFN